jgi:hypothetical protein
MDVYSFAGKKFVTILDLYSDFLEVYEVKDKSSRSCDEAYRQFVANWGHPVEVLTDQGTEFCFLKNYEVKHRRTAAYRPQSNGRLERKHRELAKQSRIHGLMPDEVAHMFNTLEVKELFYEPRNLGDTFDSGDLVLRYTPRRSRKSKSDPVWVGPIEIDEVLGDRTVKLTNGSIVNTADLKLFGEYIPVFKISDGDIMKAMDTWNEDTDQFVDVFAVKTKWKTPSSPWNSWKDRSVLILAPIDSLIDCVMKALHDFPTVAVFAVPDWKYHLAYKVLASLNADWEELDKLNVWLVRVRGAELRAVSSDWGGDVKAFLKSCATARSFIEMFPTESDIPSEHGRDGELLLEGEAFDDYAEDSDL